MIVLQDGATFLSLAQAEPEFPAFATSTGKTVSSSASGGGESVHSDLVTPPSDSVPGLHFSPAKSKSSSGKTFQTPPPLEVVRTL